MKISALPSATVTLVVTVCALMHSPTGATGRYSHGQLASLPPYCADSELSPDYQRFGPRWQYWTALMGENFNRIHHYCQGMLDVQEARRRPARSQAQVILLRRAIAEYNFILNIPANVLRSFPLWPEMLTRRGEAAVMMEDWGLAVASFEEARQVKPDYWPAYLQWADVLTRLKLNAQARDLLLKGLLIDPRVEAMREAYAKVGGSLKDLPAAPAASAAPEPPPAAASTSAAAPSPAEPASSP